MITHFWPQWTSMGAPEKRTPCIFFVRFSTEQPLLLLVTSFRLVKTKSLKPENLQKMDVQTLKKCTKMLTLKCDCSLKLSIGYTVLYLLYDDLEIFCGFENWNFISPLIITISVCTVFVVHGIFYNTFFG